MKRPEVVDDAIIGRNVAHQRGVRGVTQQQLADQMKNEGWSKWSQATVWAVEKGERPLRVGEAVTIANLLECSLNWLVSGAEMEQVAIDRADIARLDRASRLFATDLCEMGSGSSELWRSALTRVVDHLEERLSESGTQVDPPLLLLATVCVRSLVALRGIGEASHLVQSVTEATIEGLNNASLMGSVPVTPLFVRIVKNLKRVDEIAEQQGWMSNAENGRTVSIVEHLEGWDLAIGELQRGAMPLPNKSVSLRHRGLQELWRTNTIGALELPLLDWD